MANDDDRSLASGPRPVPRDDVSNLGEASLSSHRGLTNGLEQPSASGLEVDVGLINGLPTRKEGPKGVARRLAIGANRKERTARAALERKAAEPLPGADGG